MVACFIDFPSAILLGVSQACATIAPYNRIPPDDGVTPHNGVTPDDGIAPNNRVAEDDGVAPDNRATPNDRVAPDCAGRTSDRDGVAGRVEYDCRRKGRADGSGRQIGIG